jgi:hypothetical protein
MKRSASYTAEEVASGKGSYLQKLVWIMLDKSGRLDGLGVDEKCALVLRLAEEKQNRKTASARVSKWKKIACGGKNPPMSLWIEFRNLTDAQKRQLMDEVRKACGTTDHLSDETRHLSEGWTFIDHACRYCGGRILRKSERGKYFNRCAECGAITEGPYETLCTCGVEVGTHGKAFECFRRPDEITQTKQEILVRERPNVPVRTKEARPNPVRFRRDENFLNGEDFG